RRRAAERRASRVEAECGRIRTLEIMPAVLLDVLDGLGVAADAASNHVPREAVVRLESPVPVDAAGVRARWQEREAVEPAVGCGEHAADGRLILEFAPHAAD